MLGKRAAALTLVVLTAACVQEDRPVTVSLEEAREIALELVESEFEAPPPVHRLSQSSREFGRPQSERSLVFEVS